MAGSMRTHFHFASSMPTASIVRSGNTNLSSGDRSASYPKQNRRPVITTWRRHRWMRLWHGPDRNTGPHLSGRYHKISAWRPGSSRVAIPLAQHLLPGLHHRHLARRWAGYSSRWPLRAAVPSLFAIHRLPSPVCQDIRHEAFKLSVANQDQEIHSKFALGLACRQ